MFHQFIISSNVRWQRLNHKGSYQGPPAARIITSVYGVPTPTDTNLKIFCIVKYIHLFGEQPTMCKLQWPVFEVKDIIKWGKKVWPASFKLTVGFFFLRRVFDAQQLRGLVPLHGITMEQMSMEVLNHPGHSYSKNIQLRPTGLHLSSERLHQF